MAHVTCKACLADDQEAIEALGLRVLDGELTWNAARQELGWSDYRLLKNHMENHYAPAVERSQNQELLDAEAQLQAGIDEAVTDLFASMRMAPAEVKPLYAAAIRNLRGLADTKPSQQHLISALKTIQEMTGMKQEQRMMLQFAAQMFKKELADAPQKVPSLSEAVLELSAIEDSHFASTIPAEGGE